MDGGEEGDGVEEGVQLLELRGWVGFGGGFFVFLFSCLLFLSLSPSWGFFCCLLFVLWFCFLVSRFLFF